MAYLCLHDTQWTYVLGILTSFMIRFIMRSTPKHCSNVSSVQCSLVTHRSLLHHNNTKSCRSLKASIPTMLRLKAGTLLCSTPKQATYYFTSAPDYGAAFAIATLIAQSEGITVGGERFTVEPLLSCGPMLECRLMGRPPPGVPPGEDAHDGAILILGVIRVLSERRLFGKAFTTRRKLLSGEEGDAPNHQPPSMPPEINFEKFGLTSLFVEHQTKIRWMYFLQFYSFFIAGTYRTLRK